MTGGSGDDTLTLGAGVDTVQGGTGNNTFILTGAPSAGSTIIGGGGSDTLEFAGTTFDAVNNYDITGISISGVQALDADVKLTIQGSEFVFDTAANIENALPLLLADASNVGSITATDTQVAVTVATFLADEPVMAKIAGGVVISDTAANIENGLAGLLNYVGKITSITPTDTVINVSVATVLADESVLDLVAGGFAISDTATNIENGMPSLVNGILYGNLDNLISITATNAPVSMSVANFLAYQPVLNLITGSVTVSDSAANIGSNLDALETDAANIQAITLTDATTPVVNLLQTQVTIDTSVLSKITSPFDVYEYLDGLLTDKAFFYPAIGQPYTSYEYDYSPGNDFIGSKFYYTGVTGQAYTGYEYDYDGGGNVTRIAFTGVTGMGYSSYEYDFVGGVFAGSKFEVTTVPTGATYSSYELDYNSANTFTGDRFFFTSITGQSYTGEEEDFDASGKLARVLITGVSGQSYSSLEEDYSAGTYTGYKAYYTGITAQSYTGQEVDVSASNQLTKVVYTGMSSTPYSSVEQDYSAGILTDVIYDFTNVSGASAYSYQVEDNSSGAAQQEIFDNNDGSHTIIGLGAAGQTFTSIADDTFTGGGANETFVFQPIYGSDTITDFYQSTSGATHDTISLSTSEFTNFAAVLSAATNVGSNVLIKAADGDMLTLAGLNTTTLAGLPADFTFHA